jgi:sulfur transfer complex TusBCD TusB component (DsrH family)
VQGLVEEDTLMLIDDGVYLCLDRVPNTIKMILSIAQLVSKAVIVTLYTELVP